jgi:hypothetical protein
MTSLPDIDEIDLNQVSERLHQAFDHFPPSGYLQGKTAMRNALEEALHCSELQAEEMVDTLELRGFIRFDGDPSAPAEVDSAWTIEMHRVE